MTSLARLLADPPPLHVDGSGSRTLFGLSPAVLQFIDRTVEPGQGTLETGAGISTLLLAAKGARHTCVVPDQGLIERIRDCAAERDISLASTTFERGRSEDVLPGLALEGLRLALVDGRHAFPTPFIDWYYASRFLATGGRVIIDDTQLWTGDVLRRFLQADPDWRLVRDLPPRAAIFEMTGTGTHDRWWYEQDFLVRRSRAVALRGRLRKWWARLEGPRGAGPDET